jgi:hypothetical protein
VNWDVIQDHMRATYPPTIYSQQQMRRNDEHEHRANFRFHECDKTCHYASNNNRMFDNRTRDGVRTDVGAYYDYDRHHSTQEARTESSNVQSIEGKNDSKPKDI